jgi:hypothetical protein
MVSFPCKECGKVVWETYRGARAETGEIGEDLCDECEDKRLLADGNDWYSQVQLDELAGR